MMGYKINKLKIELNLKINLIPNKSRIAVWILRLFKLNESNDSEIINLFCYYLKNKRWQMMV